MNKEEVNVKFWKAFSLLTVDRGRILAKLKELEWFLILCKKRKIHFWNGIKSGKSRMKSLQEDCKIETRKRKSIDQFRHQISPNKSLHKKKGLKFRARSMKFGEFLRAKLTLTVFFNVSIWQIARFPRFQK